MRENWCISLQDINLAYSRFDFANPITGKMTAHDLVGRGPKNACGSTRKMARQEKEKRNLSWTFGQRLPSSDPLHEAFQLLTDAEQLRRQGRVDQAQAICERLVGRYPDYFGALYTLGLIYVEKKQYPRALGCLVRAAMLNPRSWKALTALSAVYLELGASEMAAHILEQAIVIKPNDPDILLTLGEVYRREREYEQARDAYFSSSQLDPTLSAAVIGYSSCCIELGQYAEAAAVLERRINDGAGSLEMLAELIELPASFVSLDLQATFAEIMRGADMKDKADKNLLAFVRAVLLDRAGRHMEAWHQVLAANRAMFSGMRRAAEEMAKTERANIDQLRSKRVQVCASETQDTRTISLFILAPSRSGKTTMEMLVGTLDGVKRGYENPSVENAIVRTFQSAGLLSSKLFEVLPPQLDDECRAAYLDELARRAGSSRVFTNTHPGRIHDAARVAAAFPNVRFIFVQRNMDDIMFRIFMRVYQSGNPYAYDLKAIREHVTWYNEMIDVLTEKLPDIARVIHYEDIVADPAAALRAAADLCGLPMNHSPLPVIGDDRGCAAPYRDLMNAALSS